jgi:hypothetical protein
MPLRALTMNRKAAVQMIAYWPRNPRKICIERCKVNEQKSFA